MASYRESGVMGKFAHIMNWSIRFFVRKKIARQAQTLSYYTLFSIVPFAALCFGIAKGFALDKMLKSMMNEHLGEHQETLNWLYRFAESALEHARGGLIAGVGVALLFLAVVKLGSCVEDIFNLLWDLPKRRSLLGKVNSYVTLLVLTPLLLIVVGSSAVWARSVTGSIMENVSPGYAGYLAGVLFCVKLIPYVIAWIVFSGLYYLIPNTKVKLVSALLGGVFAGTVFQLLQGVLIYLQVLLAGYNAIYGSFAALLLFLLWMQWSWQITLFGGVLAYVHQLAPSGKFELETVHFSAGERRRYLLAVTLLLSRKFAADGGASTVKELADKLQIQLSFAEELLEELVRCRVLLETCREGELPAYVPAHPLSKMNVMTVVSLLDTEGGVKPAPSTVPELAALEKTCGALFGVAAASPENRLLENIE